MEAIIAEIAGLMDKIERLNERQLRAKQQAQAVTERVAKKQVSLDHGKCNYMNGCIVKPGS